MILRILSALFTACLLVAHSGAVRAAPLYAAFSDGSVYGVASFGDSLSLIDQIQLPGPMSAIAAGNGGEFYTAAGNVLRRFDAAGNEIGSVSGSGTTTVPALSFASSTLYSAVTDGGFYGVARFNANLGLMSQIALPGPITGLAAGSGGEFYTAAGNTLRLYDASGSQIGTISASGTTSLPALSFAESLLFAAVTDGSFFGVAIFDDELSLIRQVSLPGPISALAAGPGGEFYTGVANTIYRFDLLGNLLGSVSGSSTTQVAALAYAPATAHQVPLPSTLSLTLAALLLLTLMNTRRQVRAGPAPCR